MEEILLKSVELGALGVFCLLLLTKGLNSLTALSDSQKTLANAIEKCAEKISAMDNRLSVVERDIRDLKADLFDIKQILKSALEEKK